MSTRHVSWEENIVQDGFRGQPVRRPLPASEVTVPSNDDTKPEPPINVMPEDPESLEGRFIQQLVRQREALRNEAQNRTCIGEFMQLLSRSRNRSEMKEELRKLREGDYWKSDASTRQGGTEAPKGNLDGSKESPRSDGMRLGSAQDPGAVNREPAPKQNDVVEITSKQDNPEFEQHYYCQMFLLFCAMTLIAAVTIARILSVESKPYVREFPESVNVGEFNLPLATLTEGEIFMHNYTYDNLVGAWIRTPSMTYGSFQIDAKTPAVTGTKLVFTPDTVPTLGKIRFDGEALVTDSYFLPWEPDQRQGLPQSIVISMSVNNVELLDLSGGAGTVGGMRFSEGTTPAKLLGNSDVQMRLDGRHLRIGSRDVLDDVLSFGTVEDTDRPVFVALTGSHLYFGACLDDQCSTERLVDMKSVYSKEIQRVSLSMNQNTLPDIELRLSTGEAKLIKCNHPICLDAAI